MDHILDNEIAEQVRGALAGLQEPVRILYFGSEEACASCAETKQLLEEVSALDERIELKAYDIQRDQEIAREFNVSDAPSIFVATRDAAGGDDASLHFQGLPSGYEFSTLINDILMASRGDSGLNEQTRSFLRNISQPLLLQVFVTPSCPYCPRAVLLAHQMAMENPRMIQAQGVEAQEFPELAMRFNVQGVPQTVINSGAGIVVGAVPEQNLLAAIKQALQN
ncbi:MAG: protein disulfide oxidoreductase [Bacteroidota bacterium]